MVFGIKIHWINSLFHWRSIRCIDASVHCHPLTIYLYHGRPMKIGVIVGYRLQSHKLGNPPDICSIIFTKSFAHIQYRKCICRFTILASFSRIPMSSNRQTVIHQPETLFLCLVDPVRLL